MRLLLVIFLLALHSGYCHAFGLLTTSAEIQNIHLVREYEVRFDNGGVAYKGDSGVDTKVRVVNLAVSAAMYRNLNLIGSISLGGHPNDNQVWISAYNIGNELSDPDSWLDGYNEFSDGHAIYRDIKVGVESLVSPELTAGLYFSSESLEANPKSNRGTYIDHSSFNEETFKVEFFSKVHYPLLYNRVFVGIKNIFTLRRSDVEQSYYHQDADNYLSFSAPSFQILTSPYISFQSDRRMSFMLALTHATFNALNSNDVSWQQFSGSTVSNVSVDDYEGKQTNLTFSVNYSL